ncbi:MAG: hypothetical protein OYG32_04775 [Rhodospirillaceae bacterium]|nr:hypothetical protein [Rhodospirillaceae bacterium]
MLLKIPNGKRRLADAVGCAVTVDRIATGETVEKNRQIPAKRERRLFGLKSRSEEVSVVE